MDLGFENRVALVVGGTGLIGTAIAGTLRAEGAITITAARGENADIVMDAADDDSVRSAVAEVLHRHGRLDALVVTAAPSARTLDPARNGDPAQVTSAFEAKAMSFLRVVTAVVPHMREAGFGRVVGISGQNALTTGNITASIRNAALIIAAQNIADELAGTGVTVNTVNPGIVTEHPSSAIEIGRAGESTPQEVASIVAFLASPRSSTSGESIAVGHRVRGVVSF